MKIWRGNSLAVQWLGLGAFTGRAQVGSLVRELRSRMPCSAAKLKKKNNNNNRNTCQTQSGKWPKFLLSPDIFKTLCTLVYPLPFSLHFQLCLYCQLFYIHYLSNIKWVSVINHRYLWMAPGNCTKDLILDILMQLGPWDLVSRVESKVQNIWLKYPCCYTTTQ